MVLKRKLPSTLKNKQGASEKTQQKEVSPSLDVPVSAPLPDVSEEIMQEKKASKPSPSFSNNPFEAQQQTHIQKKTDYKEKAPQKPAPTVKKEGIVPPSGAVDPFAAPLPPKAEEKAQQKGPVEKKPVPPVQNTDIPDPFAAPFGMVEPSKTDAFSWAEEPQSKSTSEENTETAPSVSAELPKQTAMPKEEAASLTIEKTETKTEEAPAPVMPKSQPSASTVDAKTAFLGVVATVAVAFVGYKVLLEEKDHTAEVVSRWTGALQDVSEELPEALPTEEDTEIDTGKAQAVLQPEEVVLAENVEEESFIVEEEAFQEQKAEKKDVETNAVVAFVDVPEEEVDAPILSTEETEEMPEDLGIIAQMQKEIVKAREERDGVVRPEVAEEKVEKTEKVEAPKTSSEELSLQLEEELAEYRRILAGGNLSGEILTPEEFFGEKEVAHTSQQAAQKESVDQLPKPERQSRVNSQEEALARYGDNPYNLPVVPAPSRGKDTVRTLADFDMAMFEPPTARVRIPKGMKPTLRATAFPPIILLSIVAEQGIIAEIDKRQGVLMIGEAVDGWELIAAHTEYAEFKKGNKTHVLTLGH